MCVCTYLALKMTHSAAWCISQHENKVAQRHFSTPTLHTKAPRHAWKNADVKIAFFNLRKNKGNRLAKIRISFWVTAAELLLNYIAINRKNGAAGNFRSVSRDRILFIHSEMINHMCLWPDTMKSALPFNASCVALYF